MKNNPSMFIGALVEDIDTKQIGIVLKSKIWSYDCGDKSFTTRYRIEGKPSLDFYVKWLTGEISWIHFENVQILSTKN